MTCGGTLTCRGISTQCTAMHGKTTLCNWLLYYSVRISKSTQLDLPYFEKFPKFSIWLHLTINAQFKIKEKEDKKSALSFAKHWGEVIKQQNGKGGEVAKLFKSFLVSCD